MVFDILTYGFMQKALLSGIVVSALCSLMGTFLVLRRYALFGDGIAHVAFGGISLGLFLNVFPLWTAFLLSIIGGLGLQKLRTSTKISGDAATAVILVSGLAFGVLLISASGGFSTDIFSFLFGSILLVSVEDTILIITIGAGIIGILLVLHKQFLHLSFNEEQAKVAGYNVTLLNYLFVVLAAVMVVLSMRLVGILLISALVVIPNITAMLFGKSFKVTMGIAVSIAVFSTAMGIFVSYAFNLAPSGSIVMIAVSFLLGTLACRYLGLLSKVEIRQQTKTSHNS